MASPTVDNLVDGNLVMHDHSESDLGAVLDSRYVNVSGDTMEGTLDMNYQGLTKIYANVLTVNAGGGADYTTITAALADASSGDVVLIYPGTYVEANMTIPDGVDFMGIDFGTCILGGSSGTRGPVWTFAGNNNVANLSFLSSQYVGNGSWNYTLVMVNGTATFNNCYFKHSTADNVDHFIIDTPDPTGGVLTLTNCFLTNIPSGAGGSSRVLYGIRFNSTTHQFYLQNSTIDFSATAGNFGSYGVWLKSSVGNSFTGSKIASSVSGTGTIDYALWVNGGTVAPSLLMADGPIGPGGNTTPPNLGWARFLAQTSGGESIRSTGNANFYPDATTTKPLIVQGLASQSANLTEWQDSSGTPYVSIAPSAGTFGALRVNPTILNPSGLTMATNNTMTLNLTSTNVQSVYGVTNQYTKSGSGRHAGNGVGLFNASLQQSTGQIDNFRAIWNNLSSSSTGPLVNAFGMYSSMSFGSSNVTTGAHIYLARPTSSATTTTLYGIYMEDIDVGSTNYAIYTNAGEVRLGDNTTIGGGEAGVDYTLTFDGETNDGILTWMEDEDYFQFQDNIRVPTYERHIQIPAFLAGTAANQPTATTVGTAGGLQFGFASDKSTYIQWEVPDDWVGGEDIYIEIDWLPDGAAIDYSGSSDTVNFTITYRSIAEGETITNGTAVAIPITSAEDLSQYQTKHTRFTLDFDNANQPITKQDHMYFEIKRDVSEDTFNGTVVVTAFEIIYNSVTLPTSN